MSLQRKYLNLYIGCHTNEGKLIGIKEDHLFIESAIEKKVQSFLLQTIGTGIFLHLRQLRDLTGEESIELIKKGFSIGRPKGYSFSPEAFLYLLNLNVDLFNLIRAGYAKDLKLVLPTNL